MRLADILIIGQIKPIFLRPGMMTMYRLLKPHTLVTSGGVGVQRVTDVKIRKCSRSWCDVMPGLESQSCSRSCRLQQHS